MDLSRKKILKKIPNLKPGSFNYWVKYKAGLEPVDTTTNGRFIVDLYPHDCIEKIKKVMGGK